MIKRVLITALVIFIVCLIIFWLWSGGWGSMMRVGKNLANPVDYLFGTGATGTAMRLPWQPETMTRGPDISGYASEADAYNQASGDEDQYSDTSIQPSRPSVFADASPYAGAVVLAQGNAAESDPTLEHVVVEISGNATSPIPISGWSLQSAVSGLRVFFPPAAPFFVMGVVNNVAEISLEPSASAIITTSLSPVGTSFRENICSGYLGELQVFTPELSHACPSGAEVLPMNANNMRTYGVSCFDYLNSLPQCHFPTSVPSDLSAACRSFIAHTMSYNGCVNTNRSRPGFALQQWRMYLSMRAELWYNTHDVIKLLDAEGRTVDILTY